jgi:hypothetical protein
MTSMAALGPSTSAALIKGKDYNIQSYGKENPKWLFICGAHATIDSALTDALTRAPENSSGLVIWHNTTVDKNFNFTLQEQQRQNKLVEIVKKTIQENPGLKILRAHSFGALLLDQTLNQLPELRGHVRAETYGGVVMIPGENARNYVYVQGDNIAADASACYDREGILARVRKIVKKIQRVENSPKEGAVRNAIIRAFTEETHDRLSVKGRLNETDAAIKMVAAERFQRIFIFGSGEGISLESIREGLEPWVSAVKDYNIYDMGDDPERPLGYGENLKIDDEMCKEAISRMIELGQRSLKSHVMTAFEKLPKE